MAFITAENAAELGRRSGVVRRNKREAWGNAVSFLVPVPPNTRLIEEPDTARTVGELVKIVTEQIAHTRTLLNDTEYCYCETCKRGGIEPHHRAQLIKALDSLIERKTILLGIPGPGNLKPTSSRQQARPMAVEPTPCGPTPTIDSVPLVSPDHNLPKS